MKRFNNLFYWGIGVIPLIITVIAYFFLPDVIVAHVNASGIVDRFGNRLEIFIVPCLSLFILIFFAFFFKWVQNKSTMSNTQRTVRLSKIIVSLTFSVFSICMLIYIISMTNKL